LKAEGASTFSTNRPLSLVGAGTGEDFFDRDPKKLNPDDPDPDELFLVFVAVAGANPALVEVDATALLFLATGR